MFTPRAAVLVYCDAGTALDEAVFGILHAEENLLIHKCDASAERKTKEWANTLGTCVLRVDTEESLSWQVQASLLKQVGLGNYHPGRKLSDQAVAWANGGTIPFQFKQGQHGVFIYEAPTLEPGPGDLPAISFRIRYQFAEFDGDNYVPEPPLDPENPPSTVPPVSHVAVPYLSVFPWVDSAALNAMLEDIWTGTDKLGPEPFTAQMFDGDPLDITPGNPVSAVVELAPWTEIADDTEYPCGANARCREFYFNGTSATSRNVTHVQFMRGGIRAGVAALPAPLTVPAGSGVRVPAGALGLRMVWPLDDWDVNTLEPAQRPWRRFLPYVTGGTREGIIPARQMWIEIFQDGSGEILDNWWEFAVPETWGIGSTEVGAVGLGLTGIKVAPPVTGWDWGRIRITMWDTENPVAVLADELWTPAAHVLPGERINVPSFGAILSLFAAPD
jgi:hypothetical protein